MIYFEFNKAGEIVQNFLQLFARWAHYSKTFI